MRAIFLFQFLLFEIFVSAQNLVVNPSFEEHGKEMQNLPNSDNLARNKVTGWSSATGGSCDYFRDSSRYLGHDYGSPASRSGTAKAGFCVFEQDGNYAEYREFVEGTLTQPLEKGKVYRISLALAIPSDLNYAVHHLGIYFSKKLIYDKDMLAALKEVPQLILDSTDRTGLVDNWLIYTLKYTAHGGETNFIIGNFDRNVLTKKKLVHETPKIIHYGYYYIDDVSIVPNDTPEISDTTKVPIGNVIQIPKDTLGIAPGKKLVANNVYFETDQSILKEESFPILDEIISAMKVQPNLKVEIDGHTDSDGNADHNQKLSQARADAVKQYFISKGIDSGRITTKGFGSTKPISDEKNKNRRVEFIFAQ